jgi:hypothetical protein
MPQAVIPFTPDFKSFVVTIVVAVAVLRLLFVISHVPFRRCLWQRFTVAPNTSNVGNTRDFCLPWPLEICGRLLTPRRAPDNESHGMANAVEVCMTV